MRRLHPRSLSARLALAAAAAATLAFALAGLGVLIAADHAERSALDRDILAGVTRLETTARRSQLFGTFFRGGGFPGFRPGGVRPPAKNGAGPPAVGPANGPPRAAGPPLDPGIDRFARLIDASGQVVEADGAFVPRQFPRTAADGHLRTLSVDGQRWRTVTVSLTPQGQTLEVAARLAPLESRQRRLRTIVGLALLVALGGSVMLALSLSRVALAPLARLRAGVARVRGTSDLSARVEAGGGVAETDELAGEVNAMLARLEQASTERERALDAARRFAADAGHELRTPLTSLTASLSTLGRDDPAARVAALQRAEADLARLTGLVAQLQVLARGDAGLSGTAGEVDLGELADAAIASAHHRHPTLKAELVAPPEGPLLRGDADGLRGILDNLLENAALHAGTRATVTVTLRGGGERAEIVVDDNGPGVPAEERERLLTRFARGADATAPGSGLGLAIVAAQAQRHGGDVTLGESDAGGLRVTVSLQPR